MRPPRLRIRTLMILVAAVAVMLFLSQTRQRWKRYQEIARGYDAEEKASLLLAEQAEKRATDMRTPEREAAKKYGSKPRGFIKYNESHPLRGLYEIHNWYERQCIEVENEAREHRAAAAKAKRLKQYYLSRW